MAQTARADLPYRTCVGIMLINRVGLVWIGQRRPKWVREPIWQMPQGGVLPKESAPDAALRELEEETGVRSIEIVGQSPGWLTYDLPDELVGVALKGRYRGQRQKWFAMRFAGPDSEINIKPRRGLKSEFDAWRWAYAAEATNLAIPYKRPLYEEVAQLFAAHLAAPEPESWPRTRSVSPARPWSSFFWKRARPAGA